METVSEAINRLHRAGYLDEYGADRKGLKSHGRGQVFALTSEDGTKGTYTVAFGPLMDPLDAEMVRKLGHA